MWRIYRLWELDRGEGGGGHTHTHTHPVQPESVAKAASVTVSGLVE